MALLEHEAEAEKLEQYREEEAEDTAVLIRERLAQEKEPDRGMRRAVKEADAAEEPSRCSRSRTGAGGGPCCCRQQWRRRGAGGAGG